MPRVPDPLRRFLPAGAPGAAGVAGVPTDRVADVTAELAPVLARLAATEARCDAIVEQGRQDAVQLGRRATEQVRSIVAATEQRAAGARADALARAEQEGRRLTQAQLAAAHAQAARLRTDAAGRLPGYVARVTAAVDELLGTAGPDATP